LSLGSASQKPSTHGRLVSGVPPRQQVSPQTSCFGQQIVGGPGRPNEQQQVVTAGGQNAPEQRISSGQC
jgi:hypothetical protein